MGRSRNYSARIAVASGLLLAAAAASVPFSATTAGAQTRQCFRTVDWLGSSAGGPRDLYVHVNIRDVWHLALAHDCPGGGGGQGHGSGRGEQQAGSHGDPHGISRTAHLDLPVDLHAPGNDSEPFSPAGKVH